MRRIILAAMFLLAVGFLVRSAYSQSFRGGGSFTSSFVQAATAAAMMTKFGGL